MYFVFSVVLFVLERKNQEGERKRGTRPRSFEMKSPYLLRGREREGGSERRRKRK